MVSFNLHFSNNILKLVNQIFDCFKKFFLKVGGGPTGVEFAAELNDFKEDLQKVFPIVKDHFKISLVQSASHILNSYSESISECK